MADFTSGPDLATADDLKAAAEAGRALLSGPSSRDPWRFSGERLAVLRLALEGVAMKVSGEWMADRYRQPLETRFASVGHALSEMVATTLDGYSNGGSMGARLGELARYGQQVQWTRKPGPPTAMGHAEDVAEVRKAWDIAYDDMPETGGIMDRPGAELACLLRYVAGMSPTQCAEPLGEWYGWGVKPKLIGRVTRHGAQRVYEVLRVKGMVPELPRRKGEAVAEISPNDLHGWEEIAQFCGVSKQTAQEWHERRGMPVYRFGTRHVEASSDELREWYSSSLRGEAKS